LKRDKSGFNYVTAFLIHKNLLGIKLSQAGSSGPKKMEIMEKLYSDRDES